MKLRYLIPFLLISGAMAQQSFTIANASSTGTTINTLTKLTGAPSTAVIAATTDTGRIVGIVIGGAVTSGTAVVATSGLVSCVFDGATTANDYVQISSTTGGDCHDTTSAAVYPNSGQVLGRVLTTNASGGAYVMDLYPAEFQGAMSNSSTSTTAGQAVLTTSTAGTYAPGDFWGSPYYIPAANCNNTTAGAGWSIGASGTVTCRAGTNNLGGYIAITDTSSSFAQFQVNIPEDWDTATDPYIRFFFAYPGTDGASAHTIIPEFNISCGKGDGSTTDDVTFNGFHSSSTITLSSATANLFFSGSNIQMNSTDMTACTTGSMMIVKVGRATDTATSAINVYGASITFPHKTPGTAGAN